MHALELGKPVNTYYKFVHIIFVGIIKYNSHIFGFGYIHLFFETFLRSNHYANLNIIQVIPVI